MFLFDLASCLYQTLLFFQRLRDERGAQSRLDDILGSETRNAVAKHELIEIIRTTKDRVPLRDPLLSGTQEELRMGTLVPINKGRRLVEAEIFNAAAEKIQVFGIELLDIRFKRINYNPGVIEKIYTRMASERMQIADRFRSEGAGEAAKILGRKERDLLEIESGAYRLEQEIRGKADAEATGLCYSFELVVPRALGDHGATPAAAYLVLTTVAVTRGSRPRFLSA